ncbi:CDP-diacylglycerol--glycerol-3-phosphate 3-phosphatidyltransferase [Mycoplasma sp. CSL10137]|uniref:CDP-diacylglycerol--glycerol-3-phosphate 3-phosphatidyltransferase n=1 Tax=unclassified Mycoplasma TaxID=2683645 RepID=UPI00197B7522|nr:MULTISPECIES: CDP-diacylglycerol--glycerol-3-phosphate 3-phosphatidyltransferase [unclassified Mycoplasma]MBN4083320.1 CDP-diacylglycerol--glycerol-3-phosphate 3-phosphatidyltransferase [Mycoplasma sp. CSL10137]MBN4084377.1 CDP-diacylglycerol--glycerol-3-phosphate 3-phosphatidyltransferase [Mycoplasma sp. CSL10166]
MKIFKKNKVPNLLTILRILFIIPVIGLAICFSNDYYLRFDQKNKTIILLMILVFFIIAMLTDFIDGYLARKWKVVSTFGKIFDPIADKLMTTSVLIFLSVNNFLPYTYIILLILRDIVVDAFRIIMSKNNVKVEAIKTAKWKTMTLSIAIVILFILILVDIHTENNFLYYWTWSKWVYSIYFVIPVILSTFSGYLYYKKAKQFLFS